MMMARTNRQPTTIHKIRLIAHLLGLGPIFGTPLYIGCGQDPPSRPTAVEFSEARLVPHRAGVLAQGRRRTRPAVGGTTIPTRRRTASTDSDGPGEAGLRAVHPTSVSAPSRLHRRICPGLGLDALTALIRPEMSVGAFLSGGRTPQKCIHGETGPLRSSRKAGRVSRGRSRFVSKADARWWGVTSASLRRLAAHHCLSNGLALRVREDCLDALGAVTGRAVTSWTESTVAAGLPGTWPLSVFALGPVEPEFLLRPGQGSGNAARPPSTRSSTCSTSPTCTMPTSTC